MGKVRTATMGGVTTRYLYDALGSRVSKRTSASVIRCACDAMGKTIVQYRGGRRLGRKSLEIAEVVRRAVYGG